MIDVDSRLLHSYGDTMSHSPEYCSSAAGALVAKLLQFPVRAGRHASQQQAGLKRQASWQVDQLGGLKNLIPKAFSNILGKMSEVCSTNLVWSVLDAGTIW